MNEHLSRMDRYGQPNRVKRVSAASWSLASGMAAAPPAPEGSTAEDERPTPTVRSRSDKAREEMPLMREEKKPAIGDETMVRLLIPRMAPEEQRREKVPQVPTKPEPVRSEAARGGKFESAAVAALAKLKEPVQQVPFSSSPNSRVARENEGLDDIQGRLLSAPGMEPLASPGMEPDLEMLPTRKELFPSQRLKMTRWFYNSLLYIFVIILIYLLWWGVSDSPWGKNHGL
jgi:hypothetical protein